MRWEVLAAINEIETDYGRNLNVSTAGAVGWMQFLPSTWEMYGVDANDDGRKDPYNPVDAIFAAARYLKAAGADQDVRSAIFAYNHADWYVESVLLRARLIGGLPADLVGSLTGLTQGHFPVYAKARYADDLAEQGAAQRGRRPQRGGPGREHLHRRGIRIFAKAGAPSSPPRTAGSSGSARAGGWAASSSCATSTATPTPTGSSSRSPAPTRCRASARSPSAGSPGELKLPARRPEADRARLAPAGSAPPRRPGRREAGKSRLAANGTRRRAGGQGARLREPEPPGRLQGRRRGPAHAERRRARRASFRSYFTQVYGLKRSEVRLKHLKVGSRVIAGTILGHIGRTAPTVAPNVLFEVRPAGRGAPRIDPKPILDGWKLLESTAIYRAAGKNPFFGPDARNPSIGQVLMMSKEALQRTVLQDPRIDIYSCGRRDIRAGVVDRRVLATLEFLASSGLKPTVSALRCGHGYLTASGNVSEHSSGNAVDIAAINGIPILGHQGEGSITDIRSAGC